MTDAARNVLEFANKYSICFDEESAELYVENRAALTKNPADSEAQRIAAHFAATFVFAKDDIGMDDFNKPQCPPECPECAAYERRSLARSLARFALIPPADVVAKISKSGVMRPQLLPGSSGLMGFEGAAKFLARTGLTVEAIRAMSMEDLQKYV